MTMTSASVDDLVSEATRIVRTYLNNPRTSHLCELAPVIVDLRSRFSLQDGRPDWGGRSTEYREAMGRVYENARMPAEEMDRFQSALRYHVGNLLRERATKDDLIAVGLTTLAPKERIQTTRDALQAMKETSAPRQDLARLSAYAQALLEYADDASIPELPPERAEASRLALEAVQSRSAELLVRLRDAKAQRSGGSDNDAAGRKSGRHRRVRAV